MNSVAANILITAQARQATATLNRMQAQLRALQIAGKTAQASSNGAWFGTMPEGQGRIASTRASLRGFIASTNQANAASNRPWFASMTASGSRLQWIGRQLISNFTIPVVAATAIGVKFGLDMEKSMTRVAKVYGDGKMPASQLNNEVVALRKAFIALSDTYGVQADEVANVAGEWAAAGSSGVALAKQTQLTMQTMILGEMDAAEATKSLIAIQAQWGQDTEGLTQTLRQLNAVENETGTTLSDLVVGFSRASASARTVGLQTGELAAMIAALTPAAGSASEAGNSLKTIFARMMKPTKDFTDVMGAMGIQTESTAWQSMNAGQRLKFMAESFKGLAGPQRAVVSSLAAGNWQINRFQQLMEEMGKENGYYGKTLKLLADQDRVAQIAQNELNKVLESSPQRAKQAGVIIQNSLMKAMEPLIPIIIQVALWFGKLFRAFSEISPSVRTLIVAILLALATLGPLIVAAGLVKLSIGQLAPIFMFLGRAILLPLAPLKLLTIGFWASAIRSTFMARALLGLLGVGKLFAIGMSSVGAIVIGAWRLLYAVVMSGALKSAATWAAATAINLAGVIRTLGIWALLSAGAARVWAGVRAVFATGAAAVVSLQVAWVAASAVAMKAWSVIMLVFSGATWKAMIALASGGIKGILMTIVRAGAAILAALASPWAIAIGAVVGLIVIFRKQIAQAFTNIVNYFKNLPAATAKGLSPITNIFVKAKNAIVKAFNALPAGVKNALLAVVRIVRAAALKVYELFSYINPFARHSPSLVENVTNGMAAVNRQFENSAAVAKRSIAQMHGAINSLQGLSKGLTDSNAKADDDELRSNARKAGAGNALPAYDALNSQVKQSKVILEGLNKTIETQEAKLKSIKDAVDAYDKVLEKLNSELATTQAIQDQVGKALDAAKARYDRFANAQIKGSQAADDAIFANTMAQKKLQLQIAKMEQESGTIDSVTDSYSKLQGEIETLTAKQTQLRKAGAGSDILGTYDKMIADLKKQQGGLMTGGTDSPAGKIAALNTQLQNLQKQADIMDLEKSLKFDSLNRNIDKFKNNVEELPYDQIMNGMDQSRMSVNGLQYSFDTLGQVMDGQKARIDQVQSSRDALQKTYDTESAKLDKVKESYQEVEESIRAGEQAMQDFGSAAEQAVQRQEEAARAAEQASEKLGKKKGNGKGGSGGGDDDKGAGLQAFEDAGAGDFATFGGDSAIGREGGPGDQSAEIDAFTKSLTDDLESTLGGLNPFAPLMKWWDKTVEWFKGVAGPVGDIFKNIGSAIGNAFNPGENEKVSAFGQTIQKIADGFKGFWDVIKKVGELIGGLFGPDLLTSVSEFGKGFADIWGKIVDPLKDFGTTIMPFLKSAFELLSPVLVVLVGALEVVWEVINGAIGPVFNWLGDIIKAVVQIITGVVKVITGVINVVVGLVKTIIGVIKGIFTGDWGTAIAGLKQIFVDGFGKIFGGIWDIVKGIFTAIWSTIKNFVKLIWNTIWGFVKGIIDFFVHLWDVLVGHSIIPDMVNAIIDWFKKLPGTLFNLVKNLVTTLIGFFVSLPGKILTGLGNLGTKLWQWISSAFNWIVQNGPALLVNFLTWVGTIELQILSWLGDIGTKLWEWIKAGFNWIVENGPDILLSLMNWLIGIPAQILGWLGDIGSKLWEWIKAGFQWIVDNGPDILMSFLTWVGTIELQFFQWLGNIGSKIGDWLKGAWDWVVDNAGNLLSRFWDWVKNFPSNFITGLGVIGDKLGNWIKTGWDWIVDNAGSLLSKFWEWVGGLPGKILEKLGNAKDVLKDYGKNMIQGLLDGAESLVKTIGNWFLDKLPGWIKEPFKKALGINSPSRVFMGYGQNIGEGLIAGIDGMQGQVEKASVGIAAAADKGEVAGMAVSAVADTSSVGGSVSALGDAVGAAASSAPAIDVAPVADIAPMLDAAEEAFDTFNAEMQAKMTAFTTAVAVMFAGMTTSILTSFSNIGIGGTASFASLQTQVVAIVTAMVAAVGAQLALLISQVDQFGLNLTTAWAGAWNAWQNQTTTGVDHTLTEWQRMADGMRSVFDTGIKPIFDDMAAMYEALEVATTTTVTNVGTTWDGIKEKTAAPARFVINDVYNDGLRGAWNSFNTFLGVEELPEKVARFAVGGPVDGPGTGTSDSIPAYLSKGEHVITAAEVRAAGGHKAIEATRNYWASGGAKRAEAFRNGGAVGDTRSNLPVTGHAGPGAITSPIQRAMWDAAKTAFPNVDLLSGTRYAEVGSGFDYHMQQMALDLSPIPELAKWIWELNKKNPVTELIFWPLSMHPNNINNGAPLDYGAATNAGHMDHVHWAMHRMVDNEGKLVSMAGASGGPRPVDYVQLIVDRFNDFKKTTLEKDPKFPGGIGKWIPKSVDKAMTAVDFLKPKAEVLNTKYTSGDQGNIPYDLSAGVEQWRKLATEMLIMQGESATYVDRLLMQMQSESGGNPNAINLVDSNAARGTPSKGLMQVIDPTFQSNRDPRLPNNIWDPAANIAASIRYTRGRYGSLSAWNGTGYDSGGVLPPGFTLANNQTGGPEAILTAAQWSAMFDIATKPPLDEDTIQGAVEAANIATGNTDDATTAAIMKGMDVWSAAWTPAMVDSTDAATAASEKVANAADKQSSSTVLLSKSLGKYDTQIQALSKALVAFSNSAQQSVKVTVNVKDGSTTTSGNQSVAKNSKGEQTITVEQPTFGAWAPTINALADLLDAMPYAERDWAADNPVAGETEKQRKARIAQNNLTNFAKGGYNILKDVGPPLMRHTAIIGSAVEKLVTEDGPAWSAALAAIAANNPAGYAVAVMLVLKEVATILPLILAAILDIVPALIRAIVRFLTQFMPDSVFAYADMAAAEAAVAEQQEGGSIAQGQGQRYPTDAVSTGSANAPVNLYMYGDLVMPNVSDGSDANDFVDQLKLLASQ